MSIVRNQQSLKDFISTRLNANSYGVTFVSDLFFAQMQDYFTEDENGIIKRYVPVVITDVQGEYLNVPDSNSFSANAGIVFDLFVGTVDQSTKSEAQYAEVGYEISMNAIEEFKASLLAKYFPLGTSYLYMGGEDSKIDINWDSTRGIKQFYLDFTPKNNDAEDLLTYGLESEGHIDKTATKIRFEYSSGSFLELSYTVGQNIKIIIFHDGTNWKMQDADGNLDTALASYGLGKTAILDVGGNNSGVTTGVECILKRLAFDDAQISSFDFTDVDTALTDYFIDLKTFDDKSTITNGGDYANVSITATNCILWSEDGNAIFGFGTLNPISEPRLVDGTAYYQTYELEVPVFISNDVLFGNNFEYFLDGEQIYPVGRNHTLGTSLEGVQYINSNSNQFVVAESAREHTMNFYYIPSKKLNSLLKQTVTDDVEQNQTYTLLVQYPFFQETYNVVVENGGTEPNVNTISTFSVTFKKADSILLP